VDKLRVQLEESTRKLGDLVSINRQLDANCCQLTTEKHVLQMQLTAMGGTATADGDGSVDTKVW